MGKGGIIAIVIVVIVLVAAVWLGLGFALGRADGPVTSDDRQVSGFSRVEVSGAGTVVLTTGEQAALRIEGPQDALERIDVTVDGDTLRIGQRWNWLRFGPFWDMGDITYYVSLPSLAGIELSGAVAAQSRTTVAGDELIIDASGSSEVDLDVEVGRLSIDTSGSSDITLWGKAEDASYDASGSTSIKALDLRSRTATIHCSGSSDIEVNVSEHLTVDASGSSDISYLGDPTLDSDISGSGGVEKLQE